MSVDSGFIQYLGGRIKGPKGAAALLGLNPSTLYSRMEKLGISNRRQKENSFES
jgi:formate hydrogenlyase transcriptional activator